MRSVKKSAKKPGKKALAPRKEQALKAFRHVCGRRPRIITPKEFEKLMRLLDLSYRLLNSYLSDFGYSFSRRPPEADEIIAFWYKEVQKVKHDPENVVACQQKLKTAYAAAYKKIGRKPLSWPRILSRASCIRPKLPKWPLVSHGRITTSRERVREVARQVCGEPPGIVTTSQFKEIHRQLGGIRKVPLYHHLNEIGYNTPRTSDEIDNLLKSFCELAKNSETQEEVEVLWGVLRTAVTAALQRIGRPPIKDHSIKARLYNAGLSWPHRPRAVPRKGGPWTRQIPPVGESDAR